MRARKQYQQNLGKLAERKRARVECIAARLEKAAALQQPITRRQLYASLGSNTDKSASTRTFWNRTLLMIPWLNIQPADGDDRVTVTIDHDLKRICTGEHGIISAERPGEFLCRFFKEFTQRRIDADLADTRRTWNPDAISKTDLIKILAWTADTIQAYINHNGLSANARENTAQPSPSGNGVIARDNQDQIGNAPFDAGTGEAVPSHEAGTGREAPAAVPHQILYEPSA